MHTPISRFCIVLLLLPACFGASRYPLPESKKDCSVCHVVQGGKPGALLKQPEAGLCADCHPDRTGDREHRIDVVPAMRVNGLPLANGRIACTTCHDPHDNRFGKLLRVRGRELCVRCHVK